MTDSSTTKWTVGSDAFSKMGLRYDDHHMKDDRGKYTTVLCPPEPKPDKLTNLASTCLPYALVSMHESHSPPPPS